MLYRSFHHLYVLFCWFVEHLGFQSRGIATAPRSEKSSKSAKQGRLNSWKPI
jgi:hypothetical protein